MLRTAFRPSFLDRSSLRARLLAAQLDGDRRAALGLVDEAVDAGTDHAALALDVVRWTQREIGRLWHEDRIGVAQEHQATAIAQLVLAASYARAAPAPRCGRTVLLACVEGELHELPARLAADSLELAGFDVVFLGANVPQDSLVERVAHVRPDLVALSVTMVHHLDATRRTVDALRAALRRPLPVLVGGHACAWASSLAGEPGIDGTGSDARTLIDEARRLLEVAA